MNSEVPYTPYQVTVMVSLEEAEGELVYQEDTRRLVDESLMRDAIANWTKANQRTDDASKEEDDGSA